MKQTSSRRNGFHPAQFLVDNVALLPQGRILDVAMGNGHEAVYLAQRGFEVEGVDISAERVDRALELARQAGVTIRAEVADLEGDYHIRRGAYEVIICFRFLYRPLISQFRDGLRPGGMVVYETYLVDQAQWGKPQNPEHLLLHNELLDMFRDFRCLRYNEGIISDRKAMAGIVAEKL
jgi:2-polyprenyl-3-methyl-5-hydroxy-6-metoxy-1,4-benzoquinol methylase